MGTNVNILRINKCEQCKAHPVKFIPIIIPFRRMTGYIINLIKIMQENIGLYEKLSKYASRNIISVCFQL